MHKAPSTEAAYAMGATGAKATDFPDIDAERMAFESWMRGHCWAVAAEWINGGYSGRNETHGYVCPHAMRTRQLWAAWRDRAALANPAG